MRGKADWDDGLPYLCKAPRTKQMPIMITKGCKPDYVSFYTCPKCDKVESEYKVKFDIKNLDIEYAATILINYLPRLTEDVNAI